MGKSDTSITRGMEKLGKAFHAGKGDGKSTRAFERADGSIADIDCEE